MPEKLSSQHSSPRRPLRAATLLLLLSTLIFSLVLLRPVAANSEGGPRGEVSQNAEAAEVAAAAAGSGCVTPQFALAGPPFGTGDGPVSVVTGDFDRDGKLDLVVASVVSGEVRFHVGDGTGGFPIYPADFISATPVFLAVGDFNRDGKLDVAAINNGSNDVSFLVGNEDGNFDPGSPVAVGNSPRAAVVGDFNRDGNPDLAVANQGSDNVSIRLGDGTGLFTNGADVSAGTDPVFIATGDFNRDAELDLAIVNEGSDNVSIRLGDGAGGFTNAPDVPVGDAPQAVAVGDFNLNGTLDLAVVNRGPDTLSLRRGDGDGTFTGAGGFTVGTDPTSIAAGDFNNDGKLDLAVTNSGSNTLTVRLNNGTGLFPDANAANLGTGASPSSVAIGDFNGDGRTDLAVANRGSDNVTVWRNTCDLTPCGGARFRPAPGSPFATGNFPASIAVADFNLDGKPDMAVAHRLAGHVAIRLGDGLGGFTVAPNVPTDTQATDLAAGDFNNDGKTDLAGLNTDPDMDFDNIAILLGDGAGGFTAAPDASSNAEPRSLVVADINRDGKLDLVVANNGSFSIAILAGDGAGGFTLISDVPVGQDPFSVAVADFNRDGALDLAATSFIDNAKVSIRLGDGTGNFTNAPDVPVGDYSVDIATGDFNRDGNPDFAVANRFAVFNPVGIAIRLGDGNGGFTNAPLVSAGATPGSVETADFNLDGKLDLAVVNNSFSSVVIRLGDGDGTFTSAPDVPVGVDPVATAVADFNRDGKPDLAVANSATDNVSVLLNGCPPPADLGITQTASGSRFVAGQTVTFTFTVTNNGPYAVTGTAADPGAVVTDTLSTHLTFVSGSYCTYNAATRTVTCNIANIGVGQTVTRTITARVNAAGTITNKTVVKGSGLDAVPANNSDTTTITGVTLKSVTFSPTAVAGGCGGATGTVTLTGAAPPGGALVKLASNDAGVSVPASVTIAAGQTSATFTATATKIVSANKIVGVTATLPNTNPPVSKTGSLVVTPILVSLTLSPNPVQGGTQATGTLTLACAAPQNITFALSSNNPVATPDVSSVTILAGQSSKQFTISTQTVPSRKTATIKATGAGGTRQATLVVDP